MSLEKRIATWINLGTLPYQEAFALQEKLATLRKLNKIPDTILTAQHPTEVSFGTSQKHNTFSGEFIKQITSMYGADYSLDDVRVELAKEGIGLSQVNRGGGATVVAPGQLVYYPIVNHEDLTGRTLDIGGYKSRIYRIMFESLQSLGVEGIAIHPQTSDAQLLSRDERRDIWMQKDGRSYKLGSKGLHISGPVAYHGFSLYIDKKSIEEFWRVNPCGYDPKEVSVTTVEDVLGEKVDHAQVHTAVLESIKKHFNYSMIVEKERNYLEVAA